MGAWPRRVSLRTRLAGLAAAAVGLAIALASVTSYLIVDHEVISQVNSSLRKDATSVLARPGGGPGLFLDPNDLAAIAVRGQDVIQVVDSSGAPIPALTTSAVALPVNATDRRIAASALTGPAAGAFRDITFGGHPYRLLTAPLGEDNDSGLGLAVQIAHPLTETAHTLADLRLVLVVVGTASVLLAVGLGALVAGATIRPVARLTAAAEHVAATQDLDARIEGGEGGDDELARLGHAFNDMLGALAASRRQQAQLISDAGHELRTPLTSLRTNIEVLMKVRRLPEADRAALLGDVGAQLEELTTLVGDIVELGRQDEQQPEPTEIRLDELVTRALQRARRRDGSLAFSVRLEPGAVRAQPPLLERAVLNVLDNAVKFSPPGGVVEVDLRRGDRWTLDVRDHGPGIAPEDLERVFDRFYRAPSVRSRPGSGLGLAIVRQVVTAHGGTVVAAAPHDGGTLVHIELPIVAEQEPEAPIADVPRAAQPAERGTPGPVLSDR